MRYYIQRKAKAAGPKAGWEDWCGLYEEDEAKWLMTEYVRNPDYRWRLVERVNHVIEGDYEA